MIPEIWLFVKGLFGGKGTMQIGSGNKSISGITAGDNSGGIIVGDGNVVTFGGKEEKKDSTKAHVQVRMALIHHPVSGFRHFISITILNRTDRSLFLGNFLVEKKDNSNIYCRADDATGETQRKRELKAGDSLSFHIAASTFHEIGSPATDYICATVEDAVGPSYKSDTEEFQKCVAELMKETA